MSNPDSPPRVHQEARSEVALADSSPRQQPPVIRHGLDFAGALVPAVIASATYGTVQEVPWQVLVMCLGWALTVLAYRHLMAHMPGQWQPRYWVPLATPLCACLAFVLSAPLALDAWREAWQGDKPTVETSRASPPAPLPQAREPLAVITGISVETMTSGIGAAFIGTPETEVIKLAPHGGRFSRTPLRRRLRGLTELLVCGRSLAAAYDGGKVALLSPATGKILVKRNVARSAVRLACPDGYLYAAEIGSDAFVRLDSTTLVSLSPWEMAGGRIDLMAASGPTVVTYDATRGRVTIVDTRTNATDNVDDRRGANSMAIAGGRAWLSGSDRCVRGIDLNTQEIVSRSVPLGGGAFTVATAGAHVLALGMDSGQLTAFDAWAPRAEGHLRVAVAPSAAVAVGGLVLIADEDRSTLRVWGTGQLKRFAAHSRKWRRTISCGG